MSDKSLGSDNHSGVHPKILEAIARANSGTAHAYGEDPYTELAQKRMQEVFGADSRSYFVFNGTAANILGLRTMLQSYESVLCAGSAHIQNDECGGPEFFLGSKLIALPAEQGKLTKQSLEAASQEIDLGHRGAPHHAKPKVISISQTTEYGTLYTLPEIRLLADFAHDQGLYLHMDGARISNAAAALGVSLKALTADAGVDVLSFGGTKNGLMLGEAVVFFRPELARNFPWFRKQAMQLGSKMRFLSAQFLAYLEGDLWLKNATHANQMAALLAKQVEKIPGVEITQKVQANAVFARIPFEITSALAEKVFFYVWDAKTNEVRWMTAFDTTEADIYDFAKALEALL